MGGGVNHRLSLSQAALIKDNHIMAAGSISDAFNAIKKMYSDKSIEIEVDSIDQLKEAIRLKPDLILLDNMSTDQCSEAVSITNGLVKLEASGGIAITNAKAYAATGVDYLAIGSLTHSAPALDIGLDFRKGK
jgi:nicotinate-nucleotide pyrophosphorylase (carboxylating)